ncbi:MAG TPA: preprotein translocase subunit YajC [Micavibrio sp.]|nr:preprotein translocase subunit YajC [Micavibrio sp.]
MLISQAFAQETPPVPATNSETGVAGDPALTPPSTQNMLIQNVGMIILLVLMFYFLLIRPQQKRFKEHKEMLDALKVGDKIVTSGGFIGTLDKIIDNSEVVVDLGGGVKVTALRSSIQTRADKPVEEARK